MIDGEVTWAVASNYLLLFWDLHPNLSLWNGLGDLNLTVVNISKSLPSSTKWKSLIRPGSLSLSLCVCVCVCVCVCMCVCAVYIRELPIRTHIIHLCTLPQSCLITASAHDEFGVRGRENGTSTSIRLVQGGAKHADENFWRVDSSKGTLKSENKKIHAQTINFLH